MLLQAIYGVTDLCLKTDNTDRCNYSGYCSTSDDGTEAWCSCFEGYGGDSCELNVKDLICSQMDCGFSGIQGECVTGATNDASCYCYTGWDGSDCSISVTVSVDYCEGIACNNQGECVEDLTSETNYECECNSGWAGPDCGLELPECGHEFLLDMFTRLGMISGDLDSSMECGYSKPVIWSATTPARSDPFTYPYCICSAMLETWSYDDYTQLLATCNIDNYRKIPFIEEAETYCPACGEIQDAVMEDVLTTKSAACYHFVYQRATMPLYWRSRWKCGCAMDVGNQKTTETIVTCPFTQHTSANDYISYENCGSDQICDWEGMYTYFETEYAQINLDGSVVCKDWMEAWIFTEPGDQRFEAMEDSFCPCLDYLKGTGYNDDSILDCIPVTFHQLTMLDIYTEICYDALIANVDCLNEVGYGAIQLGGENYTAAALCYGAIELASGLDEVTDNLESLMCDCIVPLYADDFVMSDTIVSALTCMTDTFDFQVETCPGYDSSTNSLDEVSDVHFSTSSNSASSSWETIATVEMPLCFILVVSAFYLQRRKKKRNM